MSVNPYADPGPPIVYERDHESLIRAKVKELKDNPMHWDTIVNEYLEKNDWPEFQEVLWSIIKDADHCHGGHLVGEMFEKAFWWQAMREVK